MYKTSVYLDPNDAERLRRASARTGRSQADLIREGVRLVTTQAEGPPPRTFHSLGRGRGGGAPSSRWDDQELYRSVGGGR